MIFDINKIRLAKQKILHFLVSTFFFYLFNQDLRFYIKISPLDSLRILVLKILGSKIGKNSYIRSNLFITNPKLLSIGESSRLGRNSSLYLYNPLTIGCFVHIGSGLTVHTSEHTIHSNFHLPIVLRGSISSPITINDNVYIGSNVTILSGVNINSNVVVAAGSVVVSSLSSGYVYGGVPAKKLRTLPEQ